MASIYTPGAVTTAKTDWKFQQSYIERLMDHAALSAAHPDDTLILAGPPRYIADNQGNAHENLLPIGMIQNMQITQQKPTTPSKAVGSGRNFFLTGGAMSNASMARLFMNGRNLLRVLYTNCVEAGVDPTLFDDPAAWRSKYSKFYANLDSELFAIPFGLAVFFRDKLHDELGGFYLELCQVNTWSIAISAGQNMIMENVNMLFDRLIPISTGGAGEPDQTDNYDPADPAASNVFLSIFQQRGVTVNPSKDGDQVPDTI